MGSHFILSVRFIASPFARFLGVTDKPIVFVPNTFCEKVYRTITKSPNAQRVEGLSKQLGWSTREVKRWFKNRRQQSKPSLMKKATESRYNVNNKMCMVRHMVPLQDFLEKPILKR